MFTALNNFMNVRTFNTTYFVNKCVLAFKVIINTNFFFSISVHRYEASIEPIPVACACIRARVVFDMN